MDNIFKTRDILFIFSGQVGQSNSLYIKNIIKEAYHDRNFDIVMISYRGRSGAKLITPKLYNALSTDDIKEPMEYVYNKYCRNTGRKCYAIGVSMGAMILSNYLGTYRSNTMLGGAVCV
jgi:predicted alpha/beta-fold hydrolase